MKIVRLISDLLFTVALVVVGITIVFTPSPLIDRAIGMLCLAAAQLVAYVGDRNFKE